MLTDDERSAAILEAQGRIRHCAVGFLRLIGGRVPTGALPAGSGTLVKVDDIGGILTAAHVVHELPSEGAVGLVRFPVNATARQQFQFDIGMTDNVTIGVPPYGENGPDLAFLRLAPNIFADITAASNFFNLTVSQQAALGGAHEIKPFFDGVVGVIAERTAPVLTSARELVTGFEASYEVGNTIAIHATSDWQRLTFEPLPAEGEKQPPDFGGVSGGALWRVPIDCENKTIKRPVIHGVAFYQTESIDGVRRLYCHGPNDIYDRLMQRVRERFSS